MHKKTEFRWYGIANSQGGYTFSNSYKSLLNWKREDNVSGIIEDVTEEYKRLKRHPHFSDFNDFLSSYP